MPRRSNVDLCRRGCQVRSCVLYLALLTCLGSKTWCVVSTGINVALHAQVPPSTEKVVGSAVTMAGVRQALLRRHQDSGNVAGGRDDDQLVEGRISEVKIAHAQIFYPFEYDGLHERPWDLVIIEGWFKMINVFIHEVSDEIRLRFLWHYCCSDRIIVPLNTLYCGKVFALSD